MKAERIILSFLALLIGLGFAGGAFYFYNASLKKQVETTQKEKRISTLSPTLDPENNILSVDNPPDESVVNNKTVKIHGKTTENTYIVVTTDSSQQVVKPASNGSFSLTETLDDGVNLIHILAIFADGTEKEVLRTVTYTTETF